MTGRKHLVTVAGLAAAFAVTACAAGPSVRGGDAGGVTVVARGTLAYAVDFAGDRLVTIELGERFALIVRALGGRELGRTDLGPPERDLSALAIAPIADQAWVGGDDGQVRGIALATGAVIATWPVGEPVTAIAVAADEVTVAIGTASGALCLRRRDDGALLQCVDVGAPIAALSVDADGALRLSSPRGGSVWSLPGLYRGPAPRSEVAPAAAALPAGWTSEGAEIAVTVGGDRVIARGRRVEAASGDLVVEMAGPVRALAARPDGTLAVAAWIRGLDDASVVLIAPTSPPPPATPTTPQATAAPPGD